MPTPVSMTSKRSSTSSPVCSTPRTCTTTSPWSVNLMALPTRLVSTWRNRPASPISQVGSSGGTSAPISRPLDAACSAKSSKISSIAVRRSKSNTSSSILPASILEKSKISLIMVSRLSPERRIVSTYSCWVGSKGVSSSNPVMPMTPFMGVRISWLMAAKNELLAREAASAASLASRITVSASLRSVTSKNVAITAGLPFHTIRDTTHSTQMRLPSRLIP